MDDAERAARRERMKAAMGPEHGPTPDKAKVSEFEGNQSTPPRRLKKGCLWIVGGILALVVLGAIFGDPPNNTVRTTVDDGPVDSAGPVDEKLVRDWFRSILETAKPCDLASADLGESMKIYGDGRGSTLAVYQAALRAENACSKTSQDYRGLQAPDGVPGAVEAAINKAHDTCSTGFVLKQMAAEKAAEIFDGAMSNSNITQLQQMSSDGQTGVLACVAEAMTAANEAGIDIETIASWNDEN